MRMRTGMRIEREMRIVDGAPGGQGRPVSFQSIRMTRLTMSTIG